MSTLMIILAIILFVLQTLSLKLVKAEGFREKLLVNCFFTLSAGILTGILCLFFPSLNSFSPPTLLCGGLFGLCFGLTILFYLSAISCGPLSYTSFYLSSSMLLPAGAGILFFRESFSPSLAVALLFFLVAFYCLNISGEDKKASRKWLIFCLLTFLCNGTCGIIQKTHQYLTNGTEAAGMMLTGFGCAALCYALCYLATGRSPVSHNSPAVKPIRVLHCNRLSICLLTVSSLGGNLLLTSLSGQTDGSYLFPLVQGSIILGVTLCSVLFFGEKLTLRGKLGILAGAAGIIILNL